MLYGLRLLRRVYRFLKALKGTTIPTPIFDEFQALLTELDKYYSDEREEAAA